MIGNHLLDYRLLKEHQEQLLVEGTLRQLAHAAPVKRRRWDRVAAARLGTALEAVARRLQALDSARVGRH